METVIHHLVKTPEWISLIIFFTCLFAFIFEVISLGSKNEYEDSKSEYYNKLEKLKCWFFHKGFAGIAFILSVSAFTLFFMKDPVTRKIITDKDYQLIKTGKIMKIQSDNPYLSSTDLEIIYEDENIIQVKFGYNEEDLFYSNHKEILLNINKKDENIINE